MVNVQELLEKEGPTETLKRARIAARQYVQGLKQRDDFSVINGDHPQIFLARDNLSEAWEDSFMALMAAGREEHTHYDPVDENGEYESFPSFEATVTMHIRNPFAEPRFHKHYLGGWMGFGDYKAEIEGVKDHWMIQPENVAGAIDTEEFDEVKGDERWNYTYSQRFRAYPWFDNRGNLEETNQLDSVVANLVRNPNSKSAQCITWDPRWDHNDGQFGEEIKWDQYHSPCLQRFWFRLREKEDGQGYILHVNGHWRSRDDLKAVPSNIFGVTEGIHEEVRLKLQEKIGVPVERGSYTDISDSLHLYGHYLDPRKQGLDAEAYLQDVFDIAGGEPISERQILPGTDMYDMMMEDIDREYNFRKENPNFGRPEPEA